MIIDKSASVEACVGFVECVVVLFSVVKPVDDASL